MTETAMQTHAEQRQVQRSAAAIQRHAVDADSPLARLQARANAGPHATALAALQGSVAQRVPANRTGLPDGLRAGLESLSGRDLSDIRVHYNSPEPAQLAAHAFAQGSEIHLAPGQERHLPHEGWHAVQQMEGRVQPTMQFQGTAINDNAGLEREASTMGAIAQRQPSQGDAPGGRTLRGYQAPLRSRSDAHTQLALHPAVEKSASRPALQRQLRGNPKQHAATTEHLAGDAKGIIQRVVKLKASQYAAGVLRWGGVMTRDRLEEYFQLVLEDDYRLACEWAYQIPAKGPDGRLVTEGELAALEAFRKAMMPPIGTPVLARHLIAADGLVALINTITAREKINHLEYGFSVDKDGVAKSESRSIPTPNTQTRYSSAPRGEKTEYTHTKLNAAAPTSWNTIADAHAMFGGAAGAVLLAGPESAPRNTQELDTNMDIPHVKKLTWGQAKEYLPRPLINLLFDVKYQLTPGAKVIDERTPWERFRKKTTPNDPGTLRSWHSDSLGILPAHVIGARLEEADALNRNLETTVETPGGIVANVPAGAAKLHKQYKDYSGEGTGSQAGQPESPLGFAEYTGTGIEGDVHNVKVVVDYASDQPRVYLTLTHYQYWALASLPNGTHEMINSKEQKITQAINELETNTPRIQEVRAAGGNYQLMNPWIEVLVP
jgi:hypothetical protein